MEYLWGTHHMHTDDMNSFYKHGCKNTHGVWILWETAPVSLKALQLEVFHNFAGQTKHIFGQDLIGSLQTQPRARKSGNMVVKRQLAWEYLV